jgi:hypothetical protein
MESLLLIVGRDDEHSRLAEEKAGVHPVRPTPGKKRNGPNCRRVKRVPAGTPNLSPGQGGGS